MKGKVAEYRSLIRRFVDGKITGDEFQKQYIKKFKAESDPLGEYFLPLDEMFGHVHVFEADPQLLTELKKERPGWYLSEVELREIARASLEKL